MKFKYTALNQQNHQMTGVLDADSIDHAKDELHKMNLSILVINNISDAEYEKEAQETKDEQEKTGIKTFIFNANDSQKKDINGTIDSDDMYTAYKRLISNYHFKVNLIHPKEEGVNLQKAQEFFDKNVGLWNAQMKEEGINVEGILATVEKGRTHEQEDVKTEGKIIEEVDRFIKEIKQILVTQNHNFSAPFMSEVQNALDRLERIKMSNNIKHVTQICNEIYDLVSHPDMIEEVTEEGESEYSHILNSLGKESHLIKPLENKNAQLEKIKDSFGKILRKISPARKIKQPVLKKMPKKKIKKESSKLKKIFQKAFVYIKTSNNLLKQRRKKELYEAIQEWYQPIKEAKERKRQMVQRAHISLNQEINAGTLQEVNSFLGWLLFFYISYFFLASFSLEKNIGLPQNFALKTVKSPLILNISILLLMGHFVLKIQNRFFKKVKLNSLLLLLVTVVAYLLIINNF